ncbi:hypothetical protein [Anabaena sp. PCC 7108]|uniref:hypothetical protein n=1 Tax=Anabaena sp. PCC 7108 TaxID=163908 RepID=UPI0003675283|nr:hypothetical protein [Anabaena sp. PCC 7108]
MNYKFVSHRIIAVFAIALLFLSGCKDPKAAIVLGTAVIGLVTTTAVSIKQVEAANLDVEAKKLQIEAIKKNGEKVTIIQALSDSQLQQIKDTGKTEIKLEDGSTLTVEVTVGSSQIATNSELEKIKSRVENSLVTLKNKDIQVSGKTTKAWIQQTSEPEDSGAATRTEWDDGVVSSILFLENSKARIWVKGVEYGGEWSWSPSGTLQVQTDQGSYYSWE